jgi:hypothetical protein
MSPLLAARAVAAGRLAIGAVMMAAPKLAMSAWIGEEEARRPATDVVTRAFGAREVLLGFLALHVADRPAVGPRTLQALAFCDATDLAVTIARRDALPGSALPLMVGLAGGALVTQLWAARELS